MGIDSQKLYTAIFNAITRHHSTIEKTIFFSTRNSLTRDIVHSINKLSQNDPVNLVPLEKWNYEDGAVLWWSFPICEPPYCGTPNDSEFYADNGQCDFTHFTRFEIPENPELPPSQASGEAL